MRKTGFNEGFSKKSKIKNFKADTVLRRDDNNSHYFTAGVAPLHQRQKSERQSQQQQKQRHTLDLDHRNNCQAMTAMNQP